MDLIVAMPGGGTKEDKRGQEGPRPIVTVVIAAAAAQHQGRSLKYEPHVLEPKPKEADMTNKTTTLLISGLALLATSTCYGGKGIENGNGPWKEVSGTAIHYFDDVPGRGVITHDVTPTDTGVKQRTTDTIDLFGDLEGRVLYQPQTVIDFTEGTLVNTGNQVFSGTVLGEGPVLLHDNLFRFDVNLATGETVGKVFLIDHVDGPVVDCVLEIIGTGFSEEGNGLADYTGRCRFRGNAGR